MNPIGRAPAIFVFHDVHDREWFSRVVDMITSDWTVVQLCEIVRADRHRKICSLTFDDGLRSVAEVAHPVLSAAAIPYSVYVCTEAATGGPAPWFLRVERLLEHLGVPQVRRHWRLDSTRHRTASSVVAALKEIPLDRLLAEVQAVESAYGLEVPRAEQMFMSACEIRTISTEGATIGSHTHRHAIMSRLPPDQQEAEIERSASALESLLGVRPEEFAYPNGTRRDFDETTIRLLKQAGFRIAVTTEQRYLTPRDDPLRLPRIGFEDGDSRARVAAKLIAPRLSTSGLRERYARMAAPR